MKTDLERLFPTTRGGNGQGEKTTVPGNPVASLSNPFGGDTKSLPDNALDAGIPCQPDFGKVCQTRKVELQPPKTGYSGRSLFDAPADSPVEKAAPSAPVEPVEAVEPVAPSAKPAPAVAAPVEPKPRLAPAEAVNAPAEAAPVTARAADAQPVELPRGWPSDIPPPPWWAEFTAALDTIWLLAARRQQCGDPACRFPVAIQWAGVEYPAQWACPRCGRATEAVNQ